MFVGNRVNVERDGRDVRRVCYFPFVNRLKKDKHSRKNDCVWWVNCRSCSEWEMGL